MILQHSPLDTPLAYLDLILWVVNVAITFLLALITFMKFNKKKDEFDKVIKENIMTWLLFYVFLGLANTLNIIWRFVVVDPQVADLIDALSIIVVLIAMLVKVFNIERSMNRANLYKGYFSTIVIIIVIGFGVVANPVAFRDVDLVLLTYFILMAIGFAVFPLIYFYLGFKSVGDARKNAFIVAIGVLLLIFGLLFQPQNIGFLTNDLDNGDLINSMFIIEGLIAFSVSVVLLFISYKKIL